MSKELISHNEKEVLPSYGASYFQSSLFPNREYPLYGYLLSTNYFRFLRKANRCL